MKRLVFILLVFFLIVGCSKENIQETGEKKLTIFCFNDVHGQIENFAKIKNIIDTERKKTNVIVTCSGDVFSGNPVVDNADMKGYPMIDLLNQIGVDVAELGNHEFDYGPSILKERLEQSDFPWICANVDMGNTGIPEPLQYYTVETNGLKITFLGLIETNGKPDATIPSSHPWKVKDFSFTRPESEVGRFSGLKNAENSDLLIALTHLGANGNDSHPGDFELARNFPFFDLIIGGHSHSILDTVINEIPIFQAGSYLNYLGKIELSIKNRSVNTLNFQLINLNNYSEYDSEIKATIENYENLPFLNDVIGYSYGFHQNYQVGCFFTEALRQKLNADASFQNTGGIRSTLDKGEITKREIYEIDPFNNGTVLYEMTVNEIKTFLKGSKSGFYYSGLQIQQSGNSVIIKDLNGNLIPDEYVLKIGLNDYIPAVFDVYFPVEKVELSCTTAETLIAYLEEINSQVDFLNCNHYFKYN